MSSEFAPPKNELRLVLFGKTGNGKSKTGNTILGEKNAFDFGSETMSVTKTCQLRNADRFERRLLLVDTPGLFDTIRKNEDVQEEIKRCIGMTCPGPHAFILCVPVGRFTEEDVSTVNFLCSNFGKEMMKYTIVLFTKYDDWKNDREDKSQDPSIRGFIDTLAPKLRDFLKTCNDIYIPFDNRLKESKADEQVKDLLKMVDKMVEENGNACYTNEDYRKAEEILQKKIEENYQKKEKELLEIKQKMETEIDSRLRKEYEIRAERLTQEKTTVRQDTQQSDGWMSYLFAGLRIAADVFMAYKGMEKPFNVHFH